MILRVFIFGKLAKYAIIRSIYYLTRFFMQSPTAIKSKFTGGQEIDASKDGKVYWLTIKEKAFCEAYAKCGIWAVAVREAYWQDITTWAINNLTYNLLNKPKCKAYIKKLIDTVFNEDTVKSILASRAIDSNRSERSQDFNTSKMTDILWLVKNAGTVSNTQILNLNNVLNIVNNPDQAQDNKELAQDFTINQDEIQAITNIK